MNALGFHARAVIDELIAQLECRGEALQGVEVTIVTKELAYRRGKFVVKKTSEERRTLGGEQVLADWIDPLDFSMIPSFFSKNCRAASKMKFVSGPELPRHRSPRLRVIKNLENPP